MIATGKICKMTNTHILDHHAPCDHAYLAFQCSELISIPDFDSKLVFLALLLSGEVLKKTKNVVDTNKIFNTIKIDKNEVNTVSMMSCSYESPKIKLAKLTITLWSLIETKAR